MSGIDVVVVHMFVENIVYDFILSDYPGRLLGGGWGELPSFLPPKGMRETILLPQFWVMMGYTI